MPIYEYSCRRCHHSFEQIVLSTREKVSCPKCASNVVEKQLSVFSSPGSRAAEAGPSGGCGCTPQTCGCH
ncbi:MAG: zinc ribbon domain-containing protein [Deltaproteobacteria bacterium]|nr:MAG: zinc ribbon domain-containing protein [Deltaproteobacteria bacterium]